MYIFDYKILFYSIILDYTNTFFFADNDVLSDGVDCFIHHITNPDHII